MKLSEAEQEALQLLADNGVVCAQYMFQGKRNEKGEDAADMLNGLARSGLIADYELRGDDTIRTYATCYNRITPAGLKALEEE